MLVAIADTTGRLTPRLPRLNGIGCRLGLIPYLSCCLPPVRVGAQRADGHGLGRLALLAHVLTSTAHIMVHLAWLRRTETQRSRWWYVGEHKQESNPVIDIVLLTQSLTVSRPSSNTPSSKGLRSAAAVFSLSRLCR